MNEQELRIAVESAFKQAQKEKIPSNELRELLKFTDNARAWGGLCFKMMRLNILQKTNDVPMKIGGSKFFYYALVKTPSQIEEETKKKFVIFNEETMKFEKVDGEIELELRINNLLEKDDYALEIYQLVEVAKPKRIIGRNRIDL